MASNRIFYATQAIGMAQHDVAASGGAPSGFVTAHGVQSVGLDTTFNLDQVFELGMLDIYENIEGIPDVQVTAQKVLDGYPLLYHLATRGASSSSLVGRSNKRAYLALNIYPDTREAASGTPTTTCGLSGMYVSSLSYKLAVDGNSTEDVTLVGNDKVWAGSGFAFLPDFAGDEPLSLTASGGVQRREDVLMGSGVSGSLWPTEIPGVDASGWNVESGDSYSAHIQTVTISSDLGREELFELGRRGPYHRFVNFPIEVTCAIETTSVKGDQVDALADPSGGTNLTNQAIKVYMREGAVFDLGDRNKLASITYGGGDTGGGSVGVTFNFSNFNSLKILHPQDPAGLVV